jgi:TPR repeat protein
LPPAAAAAPPDAGAAPPDDDPAAPALLRSAAEGGSPGAQRHLGHRLLWGVGMPRDSVAGVALLRRAADAGDLQACLPLGDAHAQGLGGLSMDAATARALYERAAAGLGDEQTAEARRRLAELSSASTAAERAAVPTGIPPMCGLASCGAPLNAGTLSGLCAGCRAVRYCGGDCQRAGWRTHRPACKAAAAARTAAAVAAAQPPTAGPTASPTPALIAERAEIETWERMPVDALRAAAEAGMPAAQAALGNAYFGGRQGLEQNQAVGLDWLRKAAAGGLLSARKLVGATTLISAAAASGAAAAVAFAEARDWCVPLAAAGDAEAQSTAYVCCMRLAAARSGDAAAALWAEAGKWLRLAVGQREPLALGALGCFTWDGHAGLGIVRDRAEAHRLFAAADAAGVTPEARAERPAGARG